MYIYKCVIPRATDACKLIDDVNDEFTNSPRERAGPSMDNNVFVHGHGAGKYSSNPLPVDRCPHASSNFPSLVFL